MSVLKLDGFVAAFVNTEDPPLSRKFLGFTTKIDGDEIAVFVLEEVRYRHPQAPEDAVLDVIRSRHLKTLRRSAMEAAGPIMFDMATKSLLFQLRREFVLND